VSEGDDFKQSLELLRDNYGCDVEYETRLLERDTAELRTGARGPRLLTVLDAPNTYEPPVTDDSLREMFSTLLG
jgi:hypothetical protein